MTRPEVSQLPPYARTPCPKCKADLTTQSYRSRFISMSIACGDHCPFGEHMHHTCEMCRYGWVTQVADEGIAG